MNTTLVRAIAEDADADEPRLVYADWCEEQGDAARAALIRVQLELAPLPSWDARRIALEVQASALIREHGERWLEALPRVAGIEWSGWSRGLVEQAKVESFAALADAHETLAGLPVQRVVVPWPADASEAAASRALPSVRQLRIERAIRDDDEPRWLAQAAVLSTLHELQLMDGYAPQSGTRTILMSEHLRQLRSLRMERHQTGIEGVHAIVEADFPELTSVALSELGDTETSWSDWDNGLDVDALGALADWDGLSRLRALDLSGNRIEADGFDALFASPHLTQLESLTLHYVFANADELPWHALEHLRLHALDVGGRTAFYEDESLDLFRNASCLSELRQLSLEQTVFEGMFEAFLDTPVARRLEVLDLSGIDPVDEGVAPLANAELPNLHTLRLRNIYGFSDAQAAPILGSKLLEPVRSLDVRGNRYSAAGVAPLIDSGHTRRLERLSIEVDPQAETLLRESALGRRLTKTGGLALE